MITSKRIRILPYRTGSKSAKALAEALEGKRLRLENSKFKPKEGDLIINWGNSSMYPKGLFGPLNQPLCTFLNYPEYIKDVSNKLTFFEKHKGNEWLPEHWTDIKEIPEDAYPIVCRTILNGHSGAGIHIASSPSDIVHPAPLYVKYKKKKDEYRIHVGLNEVGTAYVFSVQQKKRKLECANPNWQIRNHQNGFIYARDGVNPPECVLNVAEQALLASNLDFGAVDVIYNETEDRAWVLEINTAPGLEGSTVEDYKKFFLDNYLWIWYTNEVNED